jgi:hypothetical protein
MNPPTNNRRKRRTEHRFYAENYVQYAYMIEKYNNYLHDHAKQVEV